MKLWIIYSKVVLNPSKNNAISWMKDEAENCGFETEILFAEDMVLMAHEKHTIYYKGQKMALPDYVLTRCYDLHMLEHLERAGVKVFNSSQALRQCRNKWHTHQILTSAGIPSPKTIFSEHDCEFDFIKEELSLPFVIKCIFGAKGEQVHLIHSKEEFEHVLEFIDKPLFQSYVKSSYGRDIRLHVIGDQVVTSVLRKSASSFKSNFSLGGKAESYEADETLKDLAVRSSQALGLDFSGIDVMFTEDGYTVCEVNGVPGFRTVGLTSGYNIPYAMMDYIRRNI